MFDSNHRQFQAFRLIPLTQGQFAIVDAEDFNYLNQYNWSYTKHRRGGRASRNLPRRTGKRSSFMHREIMQAPEGKVVDHINGNQLDNRKANLRLATNQQNIWNSRIPKNNTSGYKGVSWNKNAGKWVANVTVNRKTLYLGLHHTPVAAHQAYIEAARKHFGEFARAK